MTAGTMTAGNGAQAADGDIAESARILDAYHRILETIAHLTAEGRMVAMQMGLAQLAIAISPPDRRERAIDCMCELAKQQLAPARGVMRQQLPKDVVAARALLAARVSAP